MYLYTGTATAEMKFLRAVGGFRSRGSSVNIVTDYELDNRGSIPDIGRGFFL
jgi:hypothetical protein